MSKVAHYLQEHLVGEVMTSPDARRYFATDASIFNIPPSIVVYARNENDVRKTARFAWQLAERNRIIPLTARGLGSDMSGASLGNGIMIVFPAHMHKIIELDGKSGVISVEPGANFGKVQQTLHTHNRFLAPYPASLEYSTIGGAIANNAGGERSFKYGSSRQMTKSLRVVLANGEVIETRRLNKRELNKKLGLNSMEGEIYRQLDTLIEENHDAINKSILPVTKNSAGYALSEIKHRDGSFDLTPVFVGSQGTLGLITEITLQSEIHNPNSTTIVAFIDEIDLAQDVIIELRKLADIPSVVDMIDDKLLEFIFKQNPTLLKGVLEPPFQKINLFIEFDNINDRNQKKAAKKAIKILNKRNIPNKIETENEAKESLQKIRNAVYAVLATNEDGAKPLPIIEDGIVPVDKFTEFLNSVYAMFKSYQLPVSVWGHAGDAHFRIQPLLNLSQVGDRQKLFKLMDDYYSLVMRLGGSTTGEHGDGRIRGSYLPQLYGPDVYELFVQVKKIFDPYNFLNPGVKTEVTIDDIKPLLRQDYDLSHFYDYLPRS